MKNRNKLPVFDLFGAGVIIAAMAVLMCCDPFGMNRKIADALRLNFPIFTREPKLLVCASVYIGSFLAKSAAVVFMALLVMARRVEPDEHLAVRAPDMRSWRGFIIPFVIIAAAVRMYYSSDPLVPNLPIRLVFSESMFLGSALVVFSILIVAPVTEEIIFRGYFFDVFKRSFGAGTSVFMTSVLFALAHGPQTDFDPLNFGIIFAIGIFFGFIRERSGSVVGPMILHCLYNLTFILVGVIFYFILGY